MYRREPPCAPDRVYVTPSSYKSVGCCYGLRRYTNCTHPLNPPPCGGLFVARDARSEWSPDAGSITRVWIGSVYTLPECFAARTAVATAAPFYNPNPTPTPPEGGAFVARDARSEWSPDAGSITRVWIGSVYTLPECFAARTAVATAAPFYNPDPTPTPPEEGAFVARRARSGRRLQAIRT